MKHALTLSLVLFAASASACSLAFWNHNPHAKTVARTMDLYVSDQPTLVIYPRGMERNGEAGKDSIKWSSKYGSTSITAFKSHAVSDGMNEHGLSAHLLYLDKSDYEKGSETLPTLSNALWAQYMLDNFKTVKEALDSMKHYRVVPTKIHGREWPIHLALEDASGDSAIIEFIDGKAVVHHGREFTVMTNEPAYQLQLDNLKKYKLFDGSLPMPGDVDSLSRFVRASSYLKTLPRPASTLEALAGVNSVISTTLVPFGAEDTSSHETVDGWPTRWVTLSDLSHKTYYFRSTLAPNIIWVDFKNLNFDKGSPVLSLDPTQVDLVGEISKQFKPVS